MSPSEFKVVSYNCKLARDVIPNLILFTRYISMTIALD